MRRRRRGSPCSLASRSAWRCSASTSSAIPCGTRSIRSCGGGDGDARPSTPERREVHVSTPQLTFGVAAAGDARHLSEFAQRAEALGFERVTMGEHVMDGTPPRPTHFALPMAAAAAGSTRRLRVMTGIVIAPLYHPVLLAKLVATVDLVSNGRFDFGIGISGQRETRMEFERSEERRVGKEGRS